MSGLEEQLHIRIQFHKVFKLKQKNVKVYTKRTIVKKQIRLNIILFYTTEFGQNTNRAIFWK